jgi:hypothetical protein
MNAGARERIFFGGGAPSGPGRVGGRGQRAGRDEAGADRALARLVGAVNGRGAMKPALIERWRGWWARSTGGAR